MIKRFVPAGMRMLTMLLSAIMVFEATAPAYAQARMELLKKMDENALILDRQLDNVAKSESTRIVRPVEPFIDNDPLLKKAQSIKFDLLFGGGINLSEDSSSAKDGGPLNYNDFYAEYSKTVNSSAEQYKAKNIAFKKENLTKINLQAEEYALSGEYSEDQINNWKQNEISNLNNWFDKAQSDLESTRQAELAKAKNLFNAYKAEVSRDADKHNKEIFQNVQSKVRSLFALYKQNPVKITPVLLETVPLFIPMNYNGENLLNKDEENIIYNLALDQLERPFSDRTKNVGLYIQAMTVVANLGRPGDGGGNAIKKALYSSFDNAPQFHTYLLLTGIPALLASKDYSTISDILSYFSHEESIVDSMDFLSIASWVDHFQTINGKYLGPVSSKTQYQMENGVVTNAYTDIALMLADEGSPQALALLKKYGVDKCMMTLDFNFKDTFSPRCGGIKPFVAGALISGKAGAENYSGPFEARRAGEQVFANNGIITVTKEESDRSREVIASNLNRFRNNVKQSGFTPNAYISINLINEALGDIGLEQEYAIDTALLKQYRNEIKNNMLASGAIVDEARRSKKQTGQTIYKYASISGNVLDIGILVWCAWDISKLARGVYSVGRGAYSAFKVSRIGNATQRMAYVTGHMPHLQKYTSLSTSVAKFSARAKNAMEPIVLGQRALYTSAPLPKILGAGSEGTAVAKALATASFDAAKGGYVINSAEAYKNAAGQPNRVLDIMNTKKALEAGSSAAKEKYINRGFLDKYKGYRGYLSSSTKEAFQTSGFDRYSAGAGIDFANNIRSADGIKWVAGSKSGASDGINWLSRPFGTPSTPGSLELYHRPVVGADAAPLPVNVTIEKKIPTINSEKITNVLLTGGDDSELVLSLAQENKIIDPEYFKIGLDNNSFSNLAKLSRGGSTPLNLKLMVEPNGLWGNTKAWSRDLFSGKKKLFAGTGSVFIKQGDALVSTPIKLSTPKPYDGIKVLVNEDNSLTLLGRNKLGLPVNFKEGYSFALPKGQLNNFVKYAKQGSFNNPFDLSLTGARNKLNTLFAVQFLSLSAASTSLVGPLRQNYPDISNTDVALISIVLPYASSFLSPFWAPFVKKFGSANMVKASLGIAGVSLMIPMTSGFTGFGDVNAMNPNKPSIAPLLLSGTLIGLSASITRSSFNPLMDKMGGGVGLLKGMAYKSLSSFAMVAPSLGAAVWDWASPRYYQDESGKFMLNDKGEKILHSHTDFSLYNPVLLALTAGIFYKFQMARMPVNIGKVEGYSMSNYAKGLSGTGKLSKGFNAVYRPVAGTMAETWNSTKVLGYKGVWPVTLAAMGALGVESSLFQNYSQTEANRYTGNYIENGAVKPVVATLALTIPSFLVRYKAKPILKMFGGSDSPETYKKLIGASLLTAGAGTALLATEDNMATFLPGMALVGIGFANTTNGLLKIGEYNLKMSKASSSVLTGYKVAYPGVHIGMAIVPKIYNSAADSEVKSDPSVSKVKALQNNIWIPAATLGATGLFYAKATNMLKFKSALRIPSGLAGLTRFTLGTPSMMIKDWRENGLFNTGFNAGGDLQIGTPSEEMFSPQALSGVMKEDAPAETEEASAK